MPYFILGIAILIGALLAARWFINAEPSTIVKALKWTTIIAIVAIATFFAFTGRISWALFALPALLPWIMRARSLARAAKNWSRMTGAASGQGGQPGQSSEVETQFLRVFLDHGSGEMDGEVLKGQFAGKSFKNLSLDELLKLLVECAADEQSVQVISAYLDRYHGDEWREKASAGNGAAGNSQMGEEEALEILGLEPGVSAEEIKSAHHRLMSKIHPDHGGSTYLATKINQAKDVLLGQT